MEELITISYNYYNKALELIKENKISKAIAELDNAIRCYSKDTDILNLMGLCQYMSCDFNRAYFYWNESLKCRTEENVAEKYVNYIGSVEFSALMEKYNMALGFIGDCKYNEAIDIFEEIKKADSQLIEPYAILGLCYYKAKNFKLSKANIEEAVRRDMDNSKFLLYLDKANNKYNGNVRGQIKVRNVMVCTLSVLLVLLTVFYCKKYADYTEAVSLNSRYEERVENDSVVLSSVQKDYEKLKDELEDEKNKNELQSTSANSEKEQVDVIEGSDLEIFNEGLEYFRRGEYGKAEQYFAYTADRSADEVYVSEATYFSAVCCEKEENYPEASKFYEDYIKNYKNNNYYDDSLYNYGLMLYRNGEKDKARIILKILADEVPGSIFVNSKVKFILNGQE